MDETVVGSGTFPWQACSPSVHVCSNPVSPGLPQFPSQAPPKPQQLRPVQLSPHLGHSERETIFAMWTRIQCSHQQQLLGAYRERLEMFLASLKPAGLLQTQAPCLDKPSCLRSTYVVSLTLGGRTSPATTRQCRNNSRHSTF